MVPAGDRGGAGAWVSMDGRNKQQLYPGDSVSISSSEWPVPTICSTDQSKDWFQSLHSMLNWNDRKAQKPR